MKDFSRRRFVLGTAAVAATGALAGCSGNGDDGNGNGGAEDDANGNGAADDPTSRVETFLGDNDALLYDGTIEDATGQDEVVIDCGAGDNGFAFDPAAVRVDPGTTVTWEWTGRGGGHNVVSEPDSDFEFESERTDEEGYSFEETLDEEGAALYVCVPHRAQGMYGGVVVE